MSLLSRLMARVYKLPAAQTCEIAVDKGLEAPMPDGVILRADRFYPRQGQRLPTVLIRTPTDALAMASLGGFWPNEAFRL